MINDTVVNLGQYIKTPARKVIESFINAIDETSIPGNYHLLNDEIYANIILDKTKKLTDCSIESHDLYTDIHITLLGSEIIRVYDRKCLETKVDYNPLKDIQFYHDSNNYSSIVVNRPGFFTMLLPRDAHRPMESVDNLPEPIIKVVIKIKNEYLQIS